MNKGFRGFRRARVSASDTLFANEGCPWNRNGRSLWIVRHGQSAGNVARDSAEAARLPLIDIVDRARHRRAVVPFGASSSPSRSGNGSARPDAGALPNVVLCSPYVRARSDRAPGVGGGGHRCRCPHPSRRRSGSCEKEFGFLDRLTTFGIRERHPQLSEQRAHVGKFSFPSAGWRELVRRHSPAAQRDRHDDPRVSRRARIDRCASGDRQLLSLHLLERMNETQILELDRVADVPNCAVMHYELPTARRERTASSSPE